MELGPTIRRRRLGSDLRRLRESRSLRLEDVAARLDVAPSTVSRIDTGKAPTKTSYLALRLASVWPVLADSFAVLSFADPADPDVAYVTGMHGQVTRHERDADVQAIRRGFGQLSQIALAPIEWAQLIDNLIRHASPSGLRSATTTTSGSKPKTTGGDWTKGGHTGDGGRGPQVVAALADCWDIHGDSGARLGWPETRIPLTILSEWEAR